MNKEDFRRKIVNEPDAMVVVFRQLIILAKENHIFHSFRTVIPYLTDVQYFLRFFGFIKLNLT